MLRRSFSTSRWVEPENPGYVTVYPAGAGRPNASNLNYTGGQTVPNAVLAKLGGAGQVDIFTLSPAHLIVDVNGYVPARSPLQSVEPARVLDTRPGQATIDGDFDGEGRIVAGSTLDVKVAGRGGIPDDATDAFLNVTVVQPAGQGFLTVFPAGGLPPNSSNVNYRAGQTVPNSVVRPHRRRGQDQHLLAL